MLQWNESDYPRLQTMDTVRILPWIDTGSFRCPSLDPLLSTEVGLPHRWYESLADTNGPGRGGCMTHRKLY